MKDVKIYCENASSVNPIQHINYSEILQHTEKKQELPGLMQSIWTFRTTLLKLPTASGRKRALALSMIPIPMTASSTAETAIP